MYFFPSYTEYTALFNISTSQSFEIKPSQPSLITYDIFLALSLSLIIIVPTLKQCSFISFIIFAPLIPDILISISTTFGLILFTSLRHSKPSAALPTTFTSHSFSSNEMIPCRTSV